MFSQRQQRLDSTYEEGEETRQSNIENGVSEGEREKGMIATTSKAFSKSMSQREESVPGEESEVDIPFKTPPKTESGTTIP